MAQPVAIGERGLWAGPAADVDCRAVRHRVARPDAAHRRDAAGLADRLGLPLIFKASFDKANRTSGKIVPRPRTAGRPARRWTRSSSVPGCR